MRCSPYPISCVAQVSRVMLCKKIFRIPPQCYSTNARGCRPQQLVFDKFLVTASVTFSSLYEPVRVGDQNLT